MLSTGLVKVVGSGFTGWAVTLALLVIGQTAAAQSTFDPYNPSTGQYQEFVTPQFPSNLALPGQARQAYDIQRQTSYGDRMSSGTAFERFLRDGFEDRFSASGSILNDSRGRSGASGAGVPYYAGTRASARAYGPNAQADRDFNAIRKERERRYFDALREKDPTKRAKLLRRVNEPIAPQDIEANEPDASGGRAGEERGAGSGAGTPASDFRIARNPDRGLARVGRERDAGVSSANPNAADPEESTRSNTKPAFRMPLAGEPLGTSTAKPTAGPAPLDPPAVKVPARVIEGPAPPTPPSRRRMNTGPERRPLMPSEIVDRNRSNTGSSARPTTPPRNPITPTPPPR